MRKKLNQYSILCAHEQAMTPHNHLPDQNNEVLLQCASCGRCLKFPVGLGQDEFKAALKEHRRVNKVKGFELAVEPELPEPLPIPAIDEPEPVHYTQINVEKPKSFWEKVRGNRS